MGYIGYSMSERAAEAYDAGEAPLSKWDRARLVREVCGYPDSEWTEDELSSATVADLRDFFLFSSSWHHTSKFFSRTDFYAVDEEVIFNHDVDALRERAARARAERAEKKKGGAKGGAPAIAKGLIVYDQWEGSRNYGRFVRKEEPCLIAGGWAYTGRGKKRLDGEHIVSCTSYTRAPRGTAGIYREIQKTLPASIRRA